MLIRNEFEGKSGLIDLSRSGLYNKWSAGDIGGGGEGRLIKPFVDRLLIKLINMVK